MRRRESRFSLFADASPVNERTVESQFEPRIATPSDLPALLELCREYCIADDHAWNAERTRKALTPLLADDQLGVVWVLGAPPVAYAVVAAAMLAAIGAIALVAAPVAGLWALLAVRLGRSERAMANLQGENQ